MIVVLDTFPTSSVAKEFGEKPSLLDLCHQRIRDLEGAGHTVLVPAIAYYEALREMEMRQAPTQIARLKAFCLDVSRFIPLSTGHLESAAELWGQVRRLGRPTAAPHALDADVILAAQALSLGLTASEFIVATTNVGHLARFVPCDLWTNISP